MKKVYYLFLTILSILCISLFASINVNAAVTEIRYDSTKGLNVSNGNAICQTDDGYIWIGQYGGLVRYDSREFDIFENVEVIENNEKVKYSLANTRRLTQIHNRLFIATDYNLFMYYNYEFTHIDLGVNNEMYNGIVANEHNLYVATDMGVFVYNFESGNVEKLHDGSIEDIALDGDNYYYLSVTGDSGTIYDGAGTVINTSMEMLDICYADGKLFACHTDGSIVEFKNEGNNFVVNNTYNVGEQVNRVIFYESCLYAATNSGLFIVYLETNVIKKVENLKTSMNLTDLIVDYEGGLWLVSRTKGVSMIPDISSIYEAKLVDYYADYSEEEFTSYQRYIYAIEKYNGKIYIATYDGIFEYDIETKKFNLDSVITVETKGNSGLGVRDLEVFNGKLYASIYQIGLLEFDGTNVNLYDESSLDPSSKTPYSKNIRALRAFDDYLLISFQGEPGGIIKFQDGAFTGVQYETGKVYPLYIYNNNGQILLVDNKKGIYTIDPDLSIESHTIVAPTDTDGEHTGFLKCMVVNGILFYNENNSLFYIKDGETFKVDLPNVYGSITEMAYIEGKYILASQTQVFIINDIFSDPISYKVLDSSEGLNADIAGNTSGFYDEENSLYYFPSVNGLYVFDYNANIDSKTVVKIALKSIMVDNEVKYGNDIHLSKDVGRITFNYSVLGFRPSQGYRVYYKLDGFNNDYVLATNDSNSIDFTNLSGGSYTLHIYAVDSDNQVSNEIVVNIYKDKHVYEQAWFWILIVILSLMLVGLINFIIINRKIKIAKKRENELKGITIESIEAIARTIDAKDTYTNGHSIRVGHFSRIIGEELGMEGDELENLYYIALLHDIGKIGIPDAILNKPGRLTDEEFEIMKSHTTKGAKILKDISTIPNIVEGAKYHHERYGGGGYPEGLKGEDIPYIARIICCADCFDAMATRRVYKDPYPKEKIISEFERCKGIQFDPKMAEVVIKLIEEGKLKTE